MDCTTIEFPTTRNHPSFSVTAFANGGVQFHFRVEHIRELNLASSEFETIRTLVRSAMLKNS